MNGFIRLSLQCNSSLQLKGQTGTSIFFPLFDRHCYWSRLLYCTCSTSSSARLIAEKGQNIKRLQVSDQYYYQRSRMKMFRIFCEGFSLVIKTGALLGKVNKASLRFNLQWQKHDLICWPFLWWHDTSDTSCYTSPHLLMLKNSNQDVIRIVLPCQMRNI